MDADERGDGEEDEAGGVESCGGRSGSGEAPGGGGGAGQDEDGEEVTGAGGGGADRAGWESSGKSGYSKSSPCVLNSRKVYASPAAEAEGSGCEAVS